MYMHRHTHTRLTALCPGLPGGPVAERWNQSGFYWSKRQVSGSGIRWAICKSAPCSRQIITPAPHRSVFYRPDALPATQPTSSKHWRQYIHVANSVTFVYMHRQQPENSANGPIYKWAHSLKYTCAIGHRGVNKRKCTVAELVTDYY